MKENDIYYELKNKLIALNGKIETIEELSKHKGDKFNIFSILGIQRKEVETHSFLLYELMNQKGSHFQKELYLKIFIEEVLKIDDFEFNCVKIDREKIIPNSNRRIDFTIENNKYYIAIEMKIDANDQKEQIFDYYKYLENQCKEPKLYYLTLDGKEASENSSKGVEYEKISFSYHILNFIEKSIEKSASLPIIRESLIQYQNTIKNITNQTTQELQMEAIKIIDNPEVARAATELSKSLAYAWGEKELYFWDKLEDKIKEYLRLNNLDKKGWIISFYDDEIRSDKLSYIVTSGYKNIYITKDDFYFRICSQRVGNFFYDITSDNKKIDTDEIAQKLNFLNKSKDVRWKFTNLEGELNFSKDYNNPTYDVFDNKKLDEIVDYIYKETIAYINIISENV